MVSTSVSHHNGHSRVGPGLGIPVKIGASGLQGLDRKESTTHKSQVAVGSVRVARRQPQIEESECPLQHGQRGNHTVCPAPKYGQIESSPGPHGKNLHPGLSEEVKSLSQAYSWPGERLGGRSFKIPGTSIEWHLPQVLSVLSDRFSFPHVDLYASPTTAQVPLYLSFCHRTEEGGLDTFLED